MNWVYWSLLSAVGWTTVSLADKVFLSRIINKPVLYLMLSSAASLLPLLLLPTAVTVPSLPPAILGLAIFSGMLSVAYNCFFFYALARTDASIISSLWLLTAVFSNAISLFVFHESIGVWTLTGTIGLLIGILVTSLEGSISQLKMGSAEKKAAVLMLFATFIASIEYAIQDRLVQHYAFVSVFYFSRMGVLAGFFILLALLRDAKTDLAALRHRYTLIVIIIAVCVELIDNGSTFSLIAAYASGPLGPAATLAATPPILIFLTVIAANSVKPDLLPSDGDRRYAWRRAIGVCLAVASAATIYVYGGH